MKHGEKVKASILTAGLAVWTANGRVTASAVARLLSMTHSAVLYHFGSSAGLCDAIAAHAVKVGDPVVIPMLIAAKHSAADGLSAADRSRYLARC